MIRSGGHKRHLTGIWLRCRTLRTLKQIHALLVLRGGLLSNPSLLRELLFCAAVSLPPSAFHYAHHLFDQIPHPDLFMYNTIIRGAAHSPSPYLAISLFSRMHLSGPRPNNLTFPFLLRACTKLSSAPAGLQLHAQILALGVDNDPFIRNALINLHANCGDLATAASLFNHPAARSDVVAWSAMIAGHARRGHLSTARNLFDKTPSKDLISWNVMITGYAKQGDMDRARELFELVPRRDVVSWNAMMAGYVQCGAYKKAMEVFEEMRRAGERPDQVTMLSLVSACADSGNLDVGERIHRSLLEVFSRSGLSVLLGNALVDMYAKCGSIERALEVFRGMREKDVSTWNSIIVGMALHGDGEASVRLFEEMCRGRVKPNDITFVGVLVACSHGGMVAEGRRYFSLMQDEYGIEPNVKHCGCMVDMLGRAGHLEEAFGFVDGMKIEPNAIVWRALLGACQLHGNVELGERANEELLKMRRDASGDYVLLSNIYAARGVWGSVEKVRQMMDDRGVMKEAGCALIEEEKKELMHFLSHDSKSVSRFKVVNP